MARPKAFDNFPPALKAPFGPYRAVTDQVHDADTVALRVDAGLECYPVVWIRLKDVHAPELSQTGGKESRDYLASLLPYETPVRLSTEKAPKSGDEQRTFERFVGVIEDEHGSINERIQKHVEENNYPRGR